MAKIDLDEIDPKLKAVLKNRTPQKNLIAKHTKEQKDIEEIVKNSKKKDNLTKQTSVYLTEEDFEILRIKAFNEKMKPSEYVRKVLLEDFLKAD